MNTQKIKIVKKGSKWAPIVNGKIYKALSAIEVAMASEAFTLTFNKQTAEAPEAFWTELDNAPAVGGID